MSVYRFSGSSLLLLLFLLLGISLLFSALITFVSGFLAIIAFDILFVGLVFDGCHFIKQYRGATPATFLIEDPLLYHKRLESRRVSGRQDGGSDCGVGFG